MPYRAPCAVATQSIAFEERAPDMSFAFSRFDYCLKRSWIDAEAGWHGFSDCFGPRRQS
jgi:hypothetical protein